MTETQKRNLVEGQIGPRSNESFSISALISIIGWGQTHQELSCALLEKDHHKFRRSNVWSGAGLQPQLHPDLRAVKKLKRVMQTSGADFSLSPESLSP